MKPNVFEVYMNDKLLNQSAEMKDYQEILEKQIIKVNQKSFNQVVILGSATFQPFMQLPAGQRRDIIEDLLDLQIFTIMNSLLKDKVLINSGSISDALNEKKIIDSKIELTKQHIQQINESNLKIISEKEKLIVETNKQIKELAKKYSKLEKEVEKIQADVGDNETVSNKLNKLSKLRHQIEAKVAMLNNDVDFFNNHENCPTCKQHIQEDFRVKTVEEKTNQIKETEEGLKLLTLEYDTANNRLKQIMNLNSQIQTLEMQKIECRTTINSLTKYSDSLAREIEKLKQVNENKSDNKIDDYEQELKQIEKTYNDLIEERNVLTAAGVLLKDGGIKSKIVKQYIPVINKLINKYLSAMDFFVSFELDENFNETIKSRYRDDFTYASFSEGEKQKIDLALLFTWRAVAKLRNSINTNLLIMDEVFDSSLDMNAVDYLMNIIRDVSKDSNIIIISHKEHMNEKFNNVLKFVKNKNFSQIQE